MSAPRLLGTLGDALPGAVDIWSAHLADGPSDAERREILTAHERDRAARIRHEQASRSFGSSRVALRTILSDYLRMEPRAVPIIVKRGKPALFSEGEDPTVHFNISHSGDFLVVAVSPDRSVGVDVERRRAIRDVASLVERALTPAERLHFDDLRSRGESADDAFLRVWTVKEARLKALGQGIGFLRAESPSAVATAPLDQLLAGQSHGDCIGCVAVA